MNRNAAQNRNAARGLVIAGTHSGVGKTSLALGIMGALRRRGHRVAPFKVGPDYIDPMFHRAVCGVPSRNLDTWLMPPEEVSEVIAAGLSSLEAVDPGEEAAKQDPLVVVEGVMGLFDGRVSAGEDCSTAQIAKLLDLPVVLVVDCSSMGRSAAAVVHGFSTFDPDLRIAGVILNKVGGQAHERMIREAIAEGPPVVGVVPRRPDLTLRSRHLGLVTAVEDEVTGSLLEAIIEHVDRNVELEALIRLARRPVPAEKRPSPPVSLSSARRVAVAYDAAFSFYYQDNLDILREEGAELTFFSPVAGDGLPTCDALYLGGGYPEVFARELGLNGGLIDDLRKARESGLPIYAECGGYLYLGQSIEYEGETFSMAGVLPTRTSMEGGGRLRLGYVAATAARNHPLAGSSFHGHLFHYSRTEGSDRPAYTVFHRGEEFADGCISGPLVASYLHLHFRGSRDIARWLAGTLEEDLK
ncbi:MAG: cobyrinate a,c-diamide synthase [Thermoleophilia bacterium]